MTRSLETATEVATEALLNCYLRESSNWRLDGGTLSIPLAGDAALQAKLRYQSPSFRHRYQLPVELATGGSSTPLGFAAVAGLLIDNLDGAGHAAQPGPKAHPTELLSRVLASVQNVATFLEARRDDLERLWSPAPQGFIDTEQALLLGHPLHPTPKSRQPMSPADVARYSPETQGRFQLRWLAVTPELVRQGSALTVDAATISAQLAERCGVPNLTGNLRGRVLLPAHPWELAHLQRQAGVAQLFEERSLIDLGPWGYPVTPTTSVRTVYQERWPWQLKFSLHVRVTNSERVTLPKELDRAVEAARLWQTQVGEAAAQVAPRFTAIHDPAFLTVVQDGQALDGFSVLFRQNPFMTGAADDGNVSSLTSLCQDDPRGGPSRLGRIVHRLAEQQRRPATEVGREWFVQFCDVAVRSLVRLYADLGLCFEPHQQNTLVALDDSGMPTRCYYRDSQGYFHRELAHDDLCRIIPEIGEASESIFPETLADERLVYYPFMNLTLGVINALGAAGAADETVLLGTLRHCLEAERAAPSRYPPTLLDRLLDDERWPCKGNLRTRYCDLDELVGDIASQSVYVTVPNPLRSLS